MSTIDRYWPQIESIEKCFRVEAEVADETTLLAVHQKMPIARKTVSNDEFEESSEEEFLADFLEEDLPSGVKVTLIEGKSGAGKSHLIRWLDAQLAMRSESNKRHVIRIPKSASLRSVVEAILLQLEGEVYDAIRSELSSAVEEMSVDDSADRLAAELKIGLDHKANELHQQRNPVDRIKLAHSQQLPHLLMDLTFRKYGLDKALKRIVRRSLEGSKEFSDDSGLVELEENRFLISDLDFDDGFPREDASREANRYHLTVLRNGDESKCKEAITVLNEVLDGALSRVFRLQEMGGISLQDIILKIRRSLLGESRELVLLIEDFAALSGVKEALLKVSIHEAIRDNQQELCTMRTAIAVTDGDMAHRDTILTRAKHTWVVKTEHVDEETTFARIENLIGAYLNAARHGAAKLGELRSTGEWDTIGGNVPCWEEETLIDEDIEILEAFGRSPSGIALFPFNAIAIRILAQAYLRRAGRLEYNPRSIINHLLREITKRRAQFEAGEFPKPIANVSPSGAVAQYVANMELKGDNQDRIKTLLAVWGGNPTKQDGLHGIDLRLGLPFKLKLNRQSPEDPQILEHDQDPEPPVTPPPPEPPIPTGHEWEEAIRTWIEDLEAWVAGNELIQSKANDLRVAVSSFLNQRIDWGALCVSGQQIEPSWVYLPNARGTRTASEITIRVGNEATDPDGSMRAALIALLRMKKANSLDYAEAPEDIVNLARYFDPIVSDVENQISQLAEQITAEVFPLLQCCSVLLLGPPENPRALAQVAQHCWFGVATSTESERETKWTDYRVKVQSLICDLMQLVHRWGGFSRGTEKTYGVAGARLKFVDLEPWPAQISTLPEILKGRLPRNPESRHLDGRRIIVALNAEWKRKLKELEILAKFGEDDIEKTMTAVKRVAGLANNAGIWRNGDFDSLDDFMRCIDEFDYGPLQSIREILGEFPAELDNGNICEALGVINSECLHDSFSTMEAVGEVIKVVQSLESDVAERDLQLKAMGSVDGAVEKFRRDLGQTRTELLRYKEHQR